MGLTTLTVQDIVFWRSGNKKIDKDAVLPFLLLPLSLLTATLSRAATVVVMLVIAMGTLYVLSRPRQKNRSPFFFSWTVSSAVSMFLVFELYVVRLLQITLLEHCIVLVSVAATCYCFYKMKAMADFELATGSSKGKVYSPVLTSDSLYCQICQIEVNNRLFHSIWWDCCVLRQNYVYFVAGQMLAFLSVFLATYLALTSVCHPYVLYGKTGTVLFPKDCDNVYFNFQMAIGFVTSVYGVGYMLVIGLVLVHQLFVYIPKYFVRPKY